MMKKLFYCSIVLLFFFLPLVVKAIDTNPGPTQSKEKVEFSLFHSKTCSHCKAEISFIDKKLRSEYGEMVNFNLYEVSESQENQQLFSQYLYFYKAKGGTVPVTFIDGEIIYGYSDDKTSGARLKEVIEQKLRIKGWSGGDNTDVVGNTGEQIIIPVLGAINPRTFSLPVLTVIIGLLDGFNPCAMWVLLFLISLLLGMENRKRMILLGSIFIVTSGAVYFVFMAAWLHFLLFIGMIFWIRLIIGAAGIGVGGKNLLDYWKNPHFTKEQKENDEIIKIVVKHDDAIKKIFEFIGCPHQFVNKEFINIISFLFWLCLPSIYILQNYFLLLVIV